MKALVPSVAIAVISTVFSTFHKVEVGKWYPIVKAAGVKLRGR